MMSTYTKKPMSWAEFTMMRGTIDFTNAAQFNFYESGYSFLLVLSRPDFIEKLSEKDAEVRSLLNLFCFVLENEFRGLSGIDDITSEALEFTDGINTIATLGKTTQQSNAELTMQFTERSGCALTRFIEYYLKGCKKSRTQAKTYHGLIKAGIMKPGFEHEVFNLLYIVTDNTLLGLEKAYLLANAWPNKAQTSIYESEKGTIEMKTIDVPFTCFLMEGDEVNRRALALLAYINQSSGEMEDGFEGTYGNGAVSNYYKKMYGDGTDIVGSAFRDNVGKEGNHANERIHPDSDNYEYLGYDYITQDNYGNVSNATFNNGYYPSTISAATKNSKKES